MKKIILIILVVFISKSAFATINVFIKTNDCIVFASDSRVTKVDSTDALTDEVLTDSYQKIIKLSNTIMLQMEGQTLYHLPNNKNVYFNGLIDEFRKFINLNENEDIFIEEFTPKFLDFINNYKLQGVNFGNLKILIAGLDSLTNFRLFEWSVKTEIYPVEIYSDTVGIDAGGYSFVVNNILSGLNEKVIQAYCGIAKDQLKRDFMTYYPEMTDSVADKIVINTLNKLKGVLQIRPKELSLDGVNVEKAIQICYYFAKVTTIVDDLYNGEYFLEKKPIPTTGGNISIGVLKKSGFEWVTDPCMK